MSSSLFYFPSFYKASKLAEMKCKLTSIFDLHLKTDEGPDILDRLQILKIALTSELYPTFQSSTETVPYDQVLRNVFAPLLKQYTENVKAAYVYTEIAFACCVGDLTAVHKLMKENAYDVLPLLDDFLVYAKPFHLVVSYLEATKERDQEVRNNFQRGNYFEIEDLTQDEKDAAFMWACINGDFEAVSKLC
jgi:hypothetical protein